MRRMILTLTLMMAASSPMAHDAMTGWAYNPYCCNGDGQTGDCQMIPAEAVKIVPGGYEVTIKPGDHRLVTHPHVFKVPQAKAMHAPDGNFHLCLYPNEDTLRCFYAPDMTY